MANKYDWEIGKSPPTIDPHSSAKHRVYEEYLAHYIQVLNTNPRIPEFDLTIVDGFAGGGEYLDINKNLYEGSPTRLIKAAQVGEAAVNIIRQNNRINKQFSLNAEFYFIEKLKSNFKYLELYLKNCGYADYINKSIYLYQTEFVNILPILINTIKTKKRAQRCLFFLDQYGYSDVPFSDIRKIFSKLPNAEVLLTFATDHLIDFMSKDRKYLKLLEKVGLNQILDIEHFLDVKEDTERWRKLVQYELHGSLLKLSGAKHYTPFFIVSTESNRSFWLVHLSNHPRARDVMTELHWQLKNHFSHYGDCGINMFGYDPDRDNSITGQTDFFDTGEYSFDEIARETTKNRLLIELPRFLHEKESGIEYGELYALIANDTPATSNQIKDAIYMLSRQKEILIYKPSGSIKKATNSIKNNDIIEINKQSTFLPLQNDLKIRRKK